LGARRSATHRVANEFGWLRLVIKVPEKVQDLSNVGVAANGAVRRYSFPTFSYVYGLSSVRAIVK